MRDPHTPIAHAYGLMMLTLSGDRVAEIVRFADAGVFGVFGLPRTLALDVSGAYPVSGSSGRYAVRRARMPECSRGAPLLLPALSSSLASAGGRPARRLNVPGSAHANSGLLRSVSSRSAIAIPSAPTGPGRSSRSLSTRRISREHNTSSRRTGRALTRSAETPASASQTTKRTLRARPRRFLSWTRRAARNASSALNVGSAPAANARSRSSRLNATRVRNHSDPSPPGGTRQPRSRDGPASPNLRGRSAAASTDRAAGLSGVAIFPPAVDNIPPTRLPGTPTDTVLRIAPAGSNGETSWRPNAAVLW